MTPDQLPPLPEGMRGYDHKNGEWHMVVFESQLRAYGLQCAEAALQEERRRCQQHAYQVIRDAEDAMSRIITGEDA